jgi:hypothetical protein
MVRADRTHVSGLVALTLLALTLTACAGDAASSVPGTYPEVTLAESKSPVQLLRNDAAGRIPTAVIDTVEDTEDISVACLDEADDPNGLVRSWNSGAAVTIVSGSQWRVDAIVNNLVESFVAQGWIARSLGGSANLKSHLLTSEKSMAEITISAKIPDADQTSISTEETVENVVVEIKVVGPCVMTEGTDSDEVKKVEGR